MFYALEGHTCNHFRAKLSIIKFEEKGMFFFQVQPPTLLK